MKTNKILHRGKKSLKTILIISLLSTVSCTKTSTKNDLSELDLKGNVKSVREISYKASEKFGEPIKEERNREFFSEEDFYHIFNTSGNITESYFYLSDESLSSKNTQQFDKQQNLIEECSYDSDGDLLYRTIYKYNDNKNISHKEIYDTDGLLESKEKLLYDKKGNHIESKTYDADGDLISKQSCEYDEQDRLIESISYNKDGKLNFNISIQYDVKGNKISDKIDYGYIKFKFEYEYDDNANISKIKTYSQENSLLYEYTYKYTLDKKLNWIQKIQIENDKPKYIIEREIEYYK